MTNEIATSTVNTPTNGLMNALASITNGRFFFSCSISFLPYSPCRFSTSSSVRPSDVVWKWVYTFSSCTFAAISTLSVLKAILLFFFFVFHIISSF